MDTFKSLQLFEKVKVIVATFFFIGYSPLVPGTVGTAAGALIYFVCAQYATTLIYIIVMTIIAAAGVWASDFAEKFYGIKDPPRVVIDEVAGFMLSMLFIKFSLFNIILGFVIFRILDIIKIPPARSFEKLHGGAGIVADDLVSGLYTNILMQLSPFILRFF